jgi:hypothetical protein
VTKARFLGGPWHWQIRDVDGRPIYYVRVRSKEPPAVDPAGLRQVMPIGREWKYRKRYIEGIYILENYVLYNEMQAEIMAAAPEKESD